MWLSRPCEWLGPKLSSTGQLVRLVMIETTLQHKFQMSITTVGPCHMGVLACKLDSLGLNNMSTWYVIEISAEEVEIMINCGHPITINITVNGKELEYYKEPLQVPFSHHKNEGFTNMQILTGAVKTSKYMSNSRPVAHLESQKHLSCPRSDLCIMMHWLCPFPACTFWTLNAELQRKIQTIAIVCFERLIGISYIDHIIKNEQVRRPIIKKRTIMKIYNPLWRKEITDSLVINKNLQALQNHIIITRDIVAEKRRGRRKRSGQATKVNVPTIRTFSNPRHSPTAIKKGKYWVGFWTYFYSKHTLVFGIVFVFVIVVIINIS